MGTRAKISVLGLYDWDSTLFDNFSLPEQVDKSDLIFNLLAETGDLTAVYPDSDFMKEAIKRWSATRLHTWERIANVLYEDYDPFINIKRDEHREITQERNLRGTGNTTNTVNAWETENPQEQSASNNTSTDTGTVKTTEHLHIEGDSAITDAQDVMRKEVEVRLKYDLYRIIINEFKQRFCLMLY